MPRQKYYPDSVDTKAEASSRVLHQVGHVAKLGRAVGYLRCRLTINGTCTGAHTQLESVIRAALEVKVKTLKRTPIPSVSAEAIARAAATTGMRKYTDATLSWDGTGIDQSLDIYIPCADFRTEAHDGECRSLDLASYKIQGTVPAVSGLTVNRVTTEWFVCDRPTGDEGDAWVGEPMLITEDSPSNSKFQIQGRTTDVFVWGADLADEIQIEQGGEQVVDSIDPDELNQDNLAEDDWGVTMGLDDADDNFLLLTQSKGYKVGDIIEGTIVLDYDAEWPAGSVVVRLGRTETHRDAVKQLADAAEATVEDIKVDGGMKPAIRDVKQNVVRFSRLTVASAKRDTFRKAARMLPAANVRA